MLWGGGHLGVGDRGDILSLLLPQTGQVLAEGPVLQLHHLKRETGGGYRCIASVPSVPGLNGTQLVNVTVSGEAPSGPRGPCKPPPVTAFGVFAGVWVVGVLLIPPAPPGSPWMAWKERRMQVKENMALNLSCEAWGHPQPNISWSIKGPVRSS